MTKNISLHPSYFGKGFQATLERKLKSESEGKKRVQFCSRTVNEKKKKKQTKKKRKKKKSQPSLGVWTETYGYVILVHEVSDFGKGKVQEETGFAMFCLKFTALVFKPFRGEVCLFDCVLCGLILTGDLQVLDAVVKQTNAHGFFANIGEPILLIWFDLVSEYFLFVFSGPVKVFVPEDHMPGDFNFDVNTLVWTSADGTVEIREETEVRCRILQVKPLDGFCLGSIKDDFLGQIDRIK
jgi:DNA-directed RNA polymerase subunit E'/Rpb7